MIRLKEESAIPSLFVQWLRRHQSKLDPLLIQALTNRSHFLRYIPHLLQFSSKEIVDHLLKIPVLIQWKTPDVFHNVKPHIQSIIPMKRHFPQIATLSSSLSLQQLQSIVNMQGIQKIFLDRKVYTCLHVATPTVHAPVYWATENQGEGVSIAVLDTGIAPHPDLDSRIIHFVDFVQGQQKPYDDNGHGTHCAGCIASTGKMSNGRYRGIAPKTKLVGVKVLGKYGESNISQVIRGIDWCIRNRKKYNIRIISLSLGSPGELSYKEDPLCLMAELAWRSGIVVVAAAGNAGPNPQTISSPGNHPSVITVGATDDRRTILLQDDQVAHFSSRGPTLDGITKPDILAPGTNIISLRSQGSFLDSWLVSNRIGNDYFYLSGTSMSTPMVAGVCALLLTKNPNLTPDEVKQCLLYSAITLHHPENFQGKGQVNAQRALKLISKS